MTAKIIKTLSGAFVETILGCGKGGFSRHSRPPLVLGVVLPPNLGLKAASRLASNQCKYLIQRMLNMWCLDKPRTDSHLDVSLHYEWRITFLNDISY